MLVRFLYKKLGNSVYIGHLETMKLFERAFRRAGIRTLYTNGYNPTVRLSFASPLSVGIESEYEVAEVHIEEESLDKFEGLDFPAGIELVDYKEVPAMYGEKKAPTLMSRLDAAEFLIFPQAERMSIPKSKDSAAPADSGVPVDPRTSSDSGASAEEFIARCKEAAESLVSSDEIPFMKRTKKGEKQVNLKDYIRAAEWKTDKNALWLRMQAGDRGSISALVVAELVFPRDSFGKSRTVRTLLLDSSGRGLY